MSEQTKSRTIEVPEDYIGQWVRWVDVESAIDDALEMAHDRSHEGVNRKGIRESVMGALDGYTPYEVAEFERALAIIDSKELENGVGQD